MTEEEAKTKWCPQTRLTGTPSDDLYSNRDDMLGAHERHARCLGSACMAWRGKPVADFAEAKAYVAQDMKINAIKALRVALPDLNLREAKDIVCGDAPWPSHEGGFCGLAGAPQ